MRAPERLLAEGPPPGLLGPPGRTTRASHGCPLLTGGVPLERGALWLWAPKLIAGLPSLSPSLATAPLFVKWGSLLVTSQGESEDQMSRRKGFGSPKTCDRRKACALPDNQRPVFSPGPVAKQVRGVIKGRKPLPFQLISLSPSFALMIPGVPSSDIP